MIPTFTKFKSLKWLVASTSLLSQQPVHFMLCTLSLKAFRWFTFHFQRITLQLFKCHWPQRIYIKRRFFCTEKQWNDLDDIICYLKSCSTIFIALTKTVLFVKLPAIYNTLMLQWSVPANKMRYDSPGHMVQNAISFTSFHDMIHFNSPLFMMRCDSLIAWQPF